VLTLLVAVFSCDLEKFCTLPDHVLWYDESHTTSLHHRGIGRVSSPSNPRTACHDTCDLHGPFDLLGQLYIGAHKMLISCANMSSKCME
jgi:hypothetical protein